jgi:hypothetical protein
LTTDTFTIKTGVCQRCLLSPLLFLLAIDWVMKETTKEKKGIQWTLWEQLEDLDFADYLDLLSHSQLQMQTKTEKLNKISMQIALKINEVKIKNMRINATEGSGPIILRGTPLEEVNSYTYLGSIVNKEGDTDEDIKIRIQKARAVSNMLRNIRKTGEIRIHTKIMIFNSNVK